MTVERKRHGRPLYDYNPACGCQWCMNGGKQPAACGDTGHGWCFESPHIPVSEGTWR